MKGTWEFTVRRRDNEHAVRIGGRMVHRAQARTRAEAETAVLERLAQKLDAQPEDFYISGGGPYDVEAMEIDKEGT